jgi:predicted glycosyltransferase
MNILFALNHPAHYYLFKYIIQGLKNKGHELNVVVKEKDILENLLKLESVRYFKISQKKKVKGKLSILTKGALELINRDIKLFGFVKSHKPDLMIGTDIAITHVGKILRIPSIVFNEDDYEINKFFCKLSYPFATAIVSPEYTSVGKHESKKIPYRGIQKMAYLNTNYYTPSSSVLKYLDLKKGQKFVIIRLVSLTAGHDIEGTHAGLSEKILNKLIPVIEKYARVFITGEEHLPQYLKKHALKIPVNKMHDLMAFATLFIGDSQSMCAEAGILGTPFIRFNDFVGKIEYLNELEGKYKLGWGVKTSEPDRLISITQSVLEKPNSKKEWIEKRNKLFADKIDLVRFTVWLIENFPESLKIIKEKTNYQENFKY